MAKSVAICHNPEKIKYKTRREAVNACALLTRTQGGAARPYRCCHHWHITRDVCRKGLRS